MSSQSKVTRGLRTAAGWLAGSLAAAALLAGCGSLDFRVGEEFDPTLLKRNLQPGVSTSAQIEALLGEPFGTGRAMMPYHDGPRTVWTYYSELGSVDLGSGAVHDKRRYLFVFLVDDVFDGYMWFDSKLQ
jgi:hypothetical protein